MITCVYCGREWQERNEACAHCGAPKKTAQITKYAPFFHEGFIVYCIREYSRRSMSWIFYKGITLIGRVDIDERELSGYSPSLDIMPMVMQRLLEQTEALDNLK